MNWLNRQVKPHVSCALALGAILIALMLPGPLVAADIYVPDDYGTIQAGINAATGGDTVIVKDGTYTGPGNVELDFGGKAITVQSENGPRDCIIDGEGAARGFIFQNNETAASVVDGFTIWNGSASNGGGIYCDSNTSPTITNCIIKYCNATSRGGGIYLINSGATITNCTIVGCTAATDGGGIRCYNTTAATIDNCTITGNSADNQGGGIACAGNTVTATVKNCTIMYNRADEGGGIYCGGAAGDVTITNCVIARNSADEGTTDNGGGILCNNTTTTIVNCTIHGNTVGTSGLGDAVYSDSCNPTIRNCIVMPWGLDSTNLIAVAAVGDEPAVTYSLVLGGYGGAGNIDGDPVFAGEGDYHLRSPASPCIDSGWGGFGVPMTDLEGTPRVDDPDVPNTGGGTPNYVNQGAYEGTAPGGTDDILWRHDGTGQVAMWFMSGLVFGAGGAVGTTIPPAWGWEIKGVGDFDADGQADIVWRNSGTGKVAFWLMDGLTISGSSILPGAIPLVWDIKGVGDFDDDGKDDIVWRDGSTGQVSVWLMDGMTISVSSSSGFVPTAWKIKGVGNFDGN